MGYNNHRATDEGEYQYNNMNFNKHRNANIINHLSSKNFEKSDRPIVNPINTTQEASNLSKNLTEKLDLNIENKFSSNPHAGKRHSVTDNNKPSHHQYNSSISSNGNNNYQQYRKENNMQLIQNQYAIKTPEVNGSNWDNNAWDFKDLKFHSEIKDRKKKLTKCNNRNMFNYKRPPKKTITSTTGQPNHLNCLVNIKNNQSISNTTTHGENSPTTNYTTGAPSFNPSGVFGEGTIVLSTNNNNGTTMQTIRANSDMFDSRNFESEHKEKAMDKNAKMNNMYMNEDPKYNQVGFTYVNYDALTELTNPEKDLIEIESNLK